ncbi:MAG: tRNA(fMet)-specific endonuclease VapC [Verrucomicrobiales bacterium]|jgi:tRNA(fMet)-specific endonuclease VapC
MTRYLLDTGIASDYVNNRLGVRQKVTQAFRRGDRVGICTPVYGELVAGVEGSNGPPRHRAQLERKLRHLSHWPFEKPAGAEFGRLMAELRQIGRPMQQVDIQIAAIALTLGCTVVTKDSDFQAIPDLTIEEWSI